MPSRRSLKSWGREEGERREVRVKRQECRVGFQPRPNQEAKGQNLQGGFANRPEMGGVRVETPVYPNNQG